MLLREELEELEEKILSPYATLSKKSAGRLKEEVECTERTKFQRDRDRIIYSKAFRRLKHKTQVFISPEGDHYRTRLTHTLEVAQIARSIARGLRLNEDLTEAISLGHDLGHTPFGHTGESVLNEICKHGFLHNEQSLRVVDYLENNNRGLNLTVEVRNGILNHSGNNIASTLEGCIVKFADRIAYINHDIEDAIEGHILTEDDLPKDCVKVLGNTSSKRINNMIINITKNCRDKNYIRMTDEYWAMTNKLRDFMFENVYIGSVAKKEEKKACNIVKGVYNCILDDPEKFLPDEWKAMLKEQDVDRVVCDYVAGMTDRYAENFFLDQICGISGI
ncbi:MAG: deoxyguanosinetriphosphate triphosphohydrolase [Clostridiales bacterium]|nr:deoxyguanosinetriphosphate triphosphohydrolase [Clostridiales bacterium]